MGRIYVADSGAHVIRRIDNDPARTTTTFVGGLGISGLVDGVAGATPKGSTEIVGLLWQLPFPDGDAGLVLAA